MRGEARRKDQPGQWWFRWEVIGVDDDLAFVRGWTDYPHEGETYHNLWVIRLAAEGRSSEFTECSHCDPSLYSRGR